MGLAVLSNFSIHQATPGTRNERLKSKLITAVRLEWLLKRKRKQLYRELRTIFRGESHVPKPVPTKKKL